MGFAVLLGIGGISCANELGTGVNFPIVERVRASSQQACSVRSESAVPSYATGKNLPLQAFFGCGTRVAIVDPTSNSTVALAVQTLHNAMNPAGTGVPDIAVGLASPDFTVNVTFSGGSGGSDWKGQVSYSSGVPSAINFDRSCTANCGSLLDVALNELTQLYGLADGSGSFWDKLAEEGGEGFSDHCASVAPATKAFEGTVCQFEVEAAWWKYGVIDSVGPTNRHIITGWSAAPPTATYFHPGLDYVGFYPYVPAFGADTVAFLALLSLGNQVHASGFRPQLALGHPSLCSGEVPPAGCTIPAATLVEYEWTADSSGSSWTSTDSSIVFGAGILGTIHHAAAVGSSAHLSSTASSPPAWLLLHNGYVLSSTEVADFVPSNCSETVYGGKTYAHWTFEWTSVNIPSGWSWEIVESSTSDPGSGTTVAVGQAQSMVTLPEYLETAGTQSRYFFIRYGGSGGTDWFPLDPSPLDLNLCAA